MNNPASDPIPQQPELSTAADDESTPLIPRDEEQYSVFSPSQKRYIILTAALASTFSPLSSNIYYAALNSIAEDLHVSHALINLTIVTYMVLQGLAPTFVGSLSDSLGRRPIYIVCFSIYIASNVALAVQDSYPALLVLRALQSAGSSGTVALATAVAADVITSAERGKYLGLASIGSILAPSIGPTLGGLLSKYFGWRSIFIFLAGAAAKFFVPFILMYPETCRRVVGDGSLEPPALNKTLLDLIQERRGRSRYQKQRDGPNASAPVKHKSGLLNPLSTLKLLFELPTGLVLLCNGLLYAGYFAVTSSMPSLFNAIYGLDDLNVGLIYVPMGIGTTLMAFINGYLVDWNFRRVAKKNKFTILSGKKQDLGHFPIEQARLQVALPMLYTCSFAVAAYGWLLHIEAPIAAPLVMLFVIGCTMTAAYNVMNVLIVDLNYSTPGTATAANNLMRCFLGAGAAAAVHPLLNYLGRGWIFTAVAAVLICVSPLLLLVYWKGADWRR